MLSFRFQHEWSFPVPARPVYEALVDVERYPLWWPQVRRAERIDEESGHAWIRSFLPYTLDLVLTRSVEDPSRGVLRVDVDGDLRGWCQWVVTEVAPRAEGLRSPAAAPRTMARFDQEAIVTPRLLARAAPVTAPLLRANHAWMMRGGRQGLAAYLAERYETLES